MIVPFPKVRPRANATLVLTLAQLLKEAQAGELQAMAYVAKNVRDGCSADSIGSMHTCISLVESLLDLISK